MRRRLAHATGDVIEVRVDNDRPQGAARRGVSTPRGLDPIEGLAYPEILTPDLAWTSRVSARTQSRRRQKKWAAQDQAGKARRNQRSRTASRCRGSASSRQERFHRSSVLRAGSAAIDPQRLSSRMRSPNVTGPVGEACRQFTGLQWLRADPLPFEESSGRVKSPAAYREETRTITKESIARQAFDVCALGRFGSGAFPLCGSSAPQEVTSRVKRLVDCEAASAKFLDQAGCLEAKLGPILNSAIRRAYAFDPTIAEAFLALMREQYSGPRGIRASPQQRGSTLKSRR